MNQDKKEKTTIWTRGFLLILCCNLFVNMAMFSVNTYLTTYMSFLGVSASLAGLVAGLYYGIGMLMRPVAGPMQANLNKKRLMIATYTLGLVVNLCYALFPTVEMFILFRMLQGIQLAFFGSLSLTIASASLPEEKMASGVGIFSLTGIAAQALGPGLSASVKTMGEKMWGESGGFRAIFLMAALFSLMSVLPALLLPETETPGKQAKSREPWYRSIVAKEALMPSAVNGLLCASSMLFTTYMIPYGAYRGIANISLYFTIYAAVMVVTRPFSGRLTDRYGARVTFYPGMALFAAAFVCISLAKSLPAAAIGAVLAAVGFGIVFPALQAMAMQSVPPERRAVASNTLYLIMDLGYFLGPTIGGMVLAATNYESMFRFGLLPLAAAVLIFAAGSKKPAQR